MLKAAAAQAPTSLDERTVMDKAPRAMLFRTADSRTRRETIVS
jgi:hypothetical protein